VRSIKARIEVHAVDDVTAHLDTAELLDAVGAVDRQLEDAVNQALDAYVDEHAYGRYERWYNLSAEPNTERVLRTALATALQIHPNDLTADYSFSTRNWENLLSEDFGGTLWRTTAEPEYVIVSCSSNVLIGCTRCGFALDTAHERVSWRQLTRTDSDGWVCDGLFCPTCDAPVATECWI
jgi:hypothetical protein